MRLFKAIYETKTGIGMQETVKYCAASDSYKVAKEHPDASKIINVGEIKVL